MRAFQQSCIAYSGKPAKSPEQNAVDFQCFISTEEDDGFIRQAAYPGHLFDDGLLQMVQNLGSNAFSGEVFADCFGELLEFAPDDFVDH